VKIYKYHHIRDFPLEDSVIKSSTIIVFLS
jgi:hypothetical protein